MKSKNICKFIPESTAERLEILCFVYESDMETITNNVTEKSNRAIIVKQGGGRINIDGRDFSFSAGDMLFTFTGERVKIASEGCEYLYISFEGARGELLFRRFGINAINRIFPGFDSMIPLWQDSLSRASEKNIDLAAEGMLLYALSRLANDTGESNGIISEVMRITEESFSDAELSLSDIASRLNYNPKYISHLFKEKAGMNYSEYLKNIRLKYAVALLDSGVDSVKNIAALSGFSDPLYFSTVFKKAVGVSPKEYTKRLKG